VTSLTAVSGPRRSRPDGGRQRHDGRPAAAGPQHRGGRLGESFLSREECAIRGRRAGEESRRPAVAGSRPVSRRERIAALDPPAAAGRRGAMLPKPSRTTLVQVPSPRRRIGSPPRARLATSKSAGHQTICTKSHASEVFGWRLPFLRGSERGYRKGVCQDLLSRARGLHERAFVKGPATPRVRPKRAILSTSCVEAKLRQDRFVRIETRREGEAVGVALFAQQFDQRLLVLAVSRRQLLFKVPAMAIRFHGRPG